MEKILEQILGELKELKENQVKMQVNIAEMRLDITGMQADIAEMRSDITGMQVDIAEMRSDIKKLDDRITKENELTRSELKEEIQQVYKELREIHTDVNTVEMVTSKNWNDIARLKSIK